MSAINSWRYTLIVYISGFVLHFTFNWFFFGMNWIQAVTEDTDHKNIAMTSFFLISIVLNLQLKNKYFETAKYNARN